MAVVGSADPPVMGEVTKGSLLPPTLLTTFLCSEPERRCYAGPRSRSFRMNLM